MKLLFLKLCHRLYLYVVRPVLFLFDSESVHRLAISFGQILGKIRPMSWMLGKIVTINNPILSQKISNINFNNPVGLAAGFDYEARLTQILPALGFGLGTVGTITRNAYGGNPKPMLGRLIKSQSLMVNKGFKNLGIHKTLKKLGDIKFKIPVGLSIGVTNTSTLSSQEDAVRDIVETFRIAENSGVPFSYYELNISCPNLQVKADFYSPEHLDQLLLNVTKNNLHKPLFIKMPIDRTDLEVMDMLKVIVKYKVQGVIFGNLQKNRNDSAIDPEEVKKFTKGNFSGKPTEIKSNELIALAYKNFGNRLTIIGCGGIFDVDDAYKKIRLGASLVQLITGMVYEGPGLVAEINLELIERLKQDGFKNISEAVGVDNVI